MSLATSPTIILKLDDLMALNGQCTGKATMDYLISKQVKFSYGVIANKIDGTSYTTLKPYINATDSNGDKLLEIWHHGYEHVIPEFRDRSYEYQKKHFEDANNRVLKLLNIQMHTFGAPGNATDSVTPIVLSENPYYHVFMLGTPYHKTVESLTHLLQRVEMENGTGNIQFDFFVKNFEKYKNVPYNYKYMIFQGHPNGWDESQLNELKKIIDYLIEKKCEFMLPYDFFCSFEINNPTNLSCSIESPNKVKLNWSCNNKVSIDYRIERSDDSISWVGIGNKIDFIPQESHKVDSISYTDTLFNPEPYYYYRVKINNGINKGYTNAVKINMPKDDTLNKKHHELKAFPNPCHSMINLQYKLNHDGIVVGMLYDMQGRIVSKLFEEVQMEGYEQKRIDISFLPPGYYECLITTSDESFVSKINVQK